MVFTDCDDEYAEGDIVVRVQGFDPVVVPHDQAFLGQYDVNRYIPMLYPLIRDGWILHLDDDDILVSPDALIGVLGLAPDEGVIYIGRTAGEWPASGGWRKGVIPRRDKRWGRVLRRSNVCSCSYVFHSKHVEHARWLYARAGDFNVLKQLEQHGLLLCWRDVVFTALQGRPGFGLRRSDDEDEGSMVPESCEDQP